MANENQNNDSVVMSPGEASDTLGFDPRRKSIKVKRPEITLGQAADDIDSTKKMKSGEEEEMEE